MQQEKIFFGPRDPHGEAAPTPSERRWAVDYRQNADCPLHSFIGNDDAKSMLATLAYDALGKDNHVCRELSLSILGPAGTGKTTLVKKFAGLIELPLVEVSPKQVKSLDDLADLIADVLDEEGLPLTPYQRDGEFILPPMVIFIDEVHALSDSVVQGLLKATEYSDSQLATEDGREINTYNVMWIIATTDSGKLFDAFRSRFATVELKALSKVDLAKVIGLNNPDWPQEAAELVSHYVPRNTRKALEFARYMRLVKKMGTGSWEAAAHKVADQYGIDEFGMHRDELAILKSLAHGPVAKGRIIYAVPGKKREEVENYILPPLMTSTPDQGALLRMSSRGYVLTDDGKAELAKRNVPVAA